MKEWCNVNFTGLKFKGSSYAAFTQNFAVNNSTSTELLEKLIKNQQNITVLIQQQNGLISKLLPNK